jgi:RNA polymerase subunit RPABC4/transcription elongation factor Spt4
MKKCRSCKTEIDNKATKCPHCQSDQRNWFRRHPIWTFFILCLVLPPFFSSFFSSQENVKKQLEPTPTPNAEQIKQKLAEEKTWEQSKAGKLCKEHTNWTKEECQSLADNKIWIGMTYEMLVAKRGKPNSANPSNYGNGNKWQWCWYDHKPSCFYDNNEDGIIDSYN